MADSSLLPALIVALEKVASDLIGVSVAWFPGGDDLQKNVKELAASYASLRRILEQGAAEDVIPPRAQEATQFLTDLLCSVENAVEASEHAENFLAAETKAGWEERFRVDGTKTFTFGFFDPKVYVDRLLGFEPLADTVQDVAKRLRNQQLIEEGNRARTVVREWEKILSEPLSPSPLTPTTPVVSDQATVNAGSTALAAKTGKGEGNGGGIRAEEANKTATKLAKKDPAFVNGGVREWAAAIRQATGKTCSIATVKDTPLWIATMKTTGRGRTKGKAPAAVGLTDSLEATIAGSEPTPFHHAAETDEAEKAIEQSGMGDNERQATLDKLRGQRMTPQEAKQLAAEFPPKPPKSVKRFRKP